MEHAKTSSYGLFLWLLTLTVVGFFSLSLFFETASNLFPASSSPLDTELSVSTMNSTVDLSWHAPLSYDVNSLSSAINGTGTYGFIFNSSSLPAGVPYGTYNWCNMPHARATEYPKVNSSYTLTYVELMHRHHKRTPYAANTFPHESYPWYCSDEGLFYYGSPMAKTDPNHPADTYWSVYTSSSNPLAPEGFNGTCQFPQITRGGLDDSFQHGKDLYGVYHDLLGFLPDEYNPEVVSFRVTNNVITSQVAGMVTSGMFSGLAGQNIPLLIQPDSIDSLEPAYSCPAASSNLSAYGPGSSDPAWTAHLRAAASLYSQLDSISGVSPTDAGFHMSFDHYFDNLSSRLCHAKPLPCNISNPEVCITQAMADEVFRLGEYEYSYTYRDAGAQTLEYSVGDYGIWVAELAQNLRHAMDGSVPASTGNTTGAGVRYRHNVAHDGSISPLLGILQIEKMVWPGMGSEVIFELYKGTKDGGYYVRVLWGGQVLKSSSPTLGTMDMVPVETLLAYIDGLVGVGASKIPGICQA